MRRRRPQPEEHTHHERWLVSYADFMTLMFALFVVLFASAYKDKHALDKVSAAVRNGFEDLQAFTPVNDPAHPRAPGSKPQANAANAAAPPTPHRESGGVDVDDLQQKLHSALGKEIENKEVVLHMTQEGFVISLHELGFFDSGEAQLLPGASDKIKRLASVLMGYGLEMRVEGHSDNVPIHNKEFNSNWDLSTARASTVAMMLLKDQGFDPSRLSIAGYGEYHPAATNDTPEGRRANRRVDIVILSATKPPAASGH